jgi:hypothetical protein
MLVGLYLREATIRVAVSQEGKRTEIVAGVSAAGDSRIADDYLARLEKAVVSND